MLQTACRYTYYALMAAIFWVAAQIVIWFVLMPAGLVGYG